MFDPSATVRFSDEKSHQKIIEKICCLKYRFLFQLELPYINKSLSDKFLLNVRHTVTIIVTPHVIPSVARDLLSCGTIFKESIDTSRSILGSMH